MKLYYIFTFAVLLFFSCNVSDNSEEIIDNSKKLKEKKSYVIVSYNVENLFDTLNDPETFDDEFTPEGSKHWTKKRYDKKISNISRVLSDISGDLPAIIALCEVEHRSVTEDLASSKALKSGHYKVIHREGPDTRGIDVALMYRSDLFNVKSYEAIPVMVKGSYSKLRNILYVKGGFAEGKNFHIFVNHWKSRRGGADKTEYKRIAAAEILRKKADEIFAEDKNAYIIILGDFNDEPGSKSLLKVLRATNNDTNPAFDEFYNLLYDKYLEGEGTNFGNYRKYMLDNLIVSRALRNGEMYYAEEGNIFKPNYILYYNAKAKMKVPDKTYGGRKYYGGYSDHLPVYFILKKKNISSKKDNL